MRRFTILNLMGLVFALAIALAALRGANEYWSSGLMMATPVIFGIAWIGAMCGKEQLRAKRMGFAILGGVYFSLVFLGVSEGNLAKLPTSRVLDYVHSRVVNQIRFSIGFSQIINPNFAIKSTASPATSTSTTTVTTDATNRLVLGRGDTGDGLFSGTIFQHSGTIVQQDVPPANPPNRWKVFFPGAANSADFQNVGHCLFAMLAGVLGAIIARRFETGRIADSQ